MLDYPGENHLFLLAPAKLDMDASIQESYDRFESAIDREETHRAAMAWHQNAPDLPVPTQDEPSSMHASLLS